MHFGMPALVDEAVEVIPVANESLLGGTRMGCRLFLPGVHGAVSERGIPLAEAPVILIRDTEQPADHHLRQRIGELSDEVESLGSLQRVEDLVGGLLDDWPPSRDRPRR